MTMSGTIARDLSERIYEYINTHKKLIWRQGWISRTTNPITGTCYKGINYFLTSMHMEEKKLQVPNFLTFKQIKTLGGTVKKGEQSTKIIYFKSSVRSAKDRDIDNMNDIASENSQHCLGHKVVSREMKPSYFLRNYLVYGIEQSTLPKESYQTQPSDYKESVDHERILKVIHEYCDREKIQVEYAGLRAFYHTKKDCIQIPRRENFDTIEAFYFTLAHELGHSTGHRDRLGRFQTSEEMDISRRNAYAYEEVVADMTSCLLLSELGLSPNIENSASYVEGWLKHWENKKQLLYRACRDAQKACDFILNKREWGNNITKEKEVVVGIV